jgi:Sec-independent protein secretion pathway component TatC
MSKNFSFSILFPLLAVALIALYGGGLGVTFIVLREVVGVEAVIVLGASLVFLVPIVAYLLTRNEPAE